MESTTKTEAFVSTSRIYRLSVAPKLNNQNAPVKSRDTLGSIWLDCHDHVAGWGSQSPNCLVNSCLGGETCDQTIDCVQ